MSPRDNNYKPKKKRERKEERREEKGERRERTEEREERGFVRQLPLIYYTKTIFLLKFSFRVGQNTASHSSHKDSAL